MTRDLLVDVDAGILLGGIADDGRVVDLWAEPSHRADPLGAVFLGRVQRTDRTAGGAFIDIGLDRPAFLPLRRRLRDRPPTDGSAVLVQVKAAPRPDKGAVVTLYIALAGRYVVHTPATPGLAFSSRLGKAESDALRRRLPLDAAAGWIVRQAATTAAPAAVSAEADRLAGLWRSLDEAADSAPRPSLLHPPPGLPLRLALDYPDVAAIRIATADIARDLRASLAAAAPELAGVVSEQAVDLAGMVPDLLTPSVRLASGAMMTIEPTRALTAVDVDAAAARDPLTANLDAAEAIARHLRLRNIGGLVVIDFISMPDRRARGQVMTRLRRSLADDPARITLDDPMSSLGLVQLARQRRGLSLAEAMASGNDTTKSPQSPFHGASP